MPTSKQQVERLTLDQSMSPGSYLQSPKSSVWLETAEGIQEVVEQEIAVLCPLICREALQKGRGISSKSAIVLPPQVTPNALKSILEYCRFHQLPGRSNKERKCFDERFVRVDTKKLCELTSAADSLQMKGLVDLTSRALARMIEGKNPEEIRETFNLPDDLTEEEKLEPLSNATDDPRIRLLNRLYARKRKELQAKQKLKGVDQEEGLQDDRSLEDLLSFINGAGKDHKSVNVGKCKKKRNRRKRDTSKSQINSEDGGLREATKSAAHLSSDADLHQSCPPAREEGSCFEIGFDVDDELDPSIKEELDREVEDFARRLNSDWPERKQMQDYPVVSTNGQKQSGHLSLQITSIPLSDSWGR